MTDDLLDYSAERNRDETSDAVSLDQGNSVPPAENITEATQSGVDRSHDSTGPWDQLAHWEDEDFDIDFQISGLPAFPNQFQRTQPALGFTGTCNLDTACVGTNGCQTNGCIPHTQLCPPNTNQCPTHGCIPHTQLCPPNTNQCPTHGCIPHTQLCPPNTNQCPTHGCIPHTQACGTDLIGTCGCHTQGGCGATHEIGTCGTCGCLVSGFGNRNNTSLDATCGCQTQTCGCQTNQYTCSCVPTSQQAGCPPWTQQAHCTDQSQVTQQNATCGCLATTPQTTCGCNQPQNPKTPKPQ